MEEPKEIVIRKKLQRITMRYLLVSIMDAFDIEKGFLFSLKSFLKNPGQAFQSYLNEDRYRHSNPFKLAVVLTAITVFLTLEFGLTDMIKSGVVDGQGANVPAEEVAQTSALFDTMINEYYNVMMLGALPVLAMVSFLFYRKTGYNYAEHLTLNCFMFSVTSVLYWVFLPFQIFAPSVLSLYILVTFGYQIWTYRSAFGSTILRAFMASFIGYLIYFILFVVIMTSVLLTQMIQSGELIAK